MFYNEKNKFGLVFLYLKKSMRNTKNVEMMKKWMVILGIISTSLCKGQQLSLFSQYMLNGMLYNPAIVGSVKDSRITFTERRQWIGLKNGLNVSGVSFDTPLNYNRIGVGGVIIHQQFGEDRNIAANLVTSYKIIIGRGIMSFGLNLGIQRASIFYNNLEIYDLDDIVIQESSISMPEVGVGFYYLHDRYFLGSSVKQLSSGNQTSFTQEKHYYLMGGYRSSITDDCELRFSSLVKYVSGVPFQWDKTIHLYFKESVWCGVSHRNSLLMSFQAGVMLHKLVQKINKMISLGYSYDLGEGRLKQNHNGSHELVVNYRFRLPIKAKRIEKRKPIVSPKFFY